MRSDPSRDPARDDDRAFDPRRERDAVPAALSRATLWPFAISIFLPGVLLVLFLALTPMGHALVGSLAQLGRPVKTVEDRLAEFGAPARERWRARFSAIGAAYPPAELAFVALKEERVLEVYVPEDRASEDRASEDRASEAQQSLARAPAGDAGASWRRVAAFPIEAASGVVGPKLREGDQQVPEGIYRVESLHPNSLFHAALRLDYPNEFDRSMASRDGRTDQRVPLGGDIMIHGRDQSVGCLAMGDEPIEDLFTLVADTGADAVRVVIAPWDLRIRAAPDAESLDETAQAWAPELYKAISRVLSQFPRDTPAP
ncbi:MAG: L,D-transpeptidase family protein [Phycisphaera sp.]|nr:L,D-transpeptidase family protein [Phycisphaera sp.]